MAVIYREYLMRFTFNLIFTWSFAWICRSIVDSRSKVCYCFSCTFFFFLSNSSIRSDLESGIGVINYAKKRTLLSANIEFLLLIICTAYIRLLRIIIRVEDYDVNLRVSMIVRYLKYKKGYVRKGTSFSFKNYSSRSKYYYKHERKRMLRTCLVLKII